MRALIFLIFFSPLLYSQNGKDIFYFSVTGDTILVPTFGDNDSTCLHIFKFTDTKVIDLKSIIIPTLDNYSFLQSVLMDYNLKIKGHKVPNDKENVFINEKVLSNQQIGLSIYPSNYLFRAKIKISFSYKMKVVKKHVDDKDYFAKEKKDFTKEMFFEPIIVKMDNHAIYFVTFLPRLYDTEKRPGEWELLTEPDYAHYLVRQIK